MRTHCAVPLGLLLLLAGAVSAAEPKTVDLTVTNWRGVERLVAGQRGKIVLVDVWTTTCATCVREFPEFAALRERFGKRVALIGVNCDYDGIADKPPAFYREGVETFLRKRKATFSNVMLDEAFIDFLDDRDLGSTPAVYVFGTDGTLLKRFDNDDADSEEEEFDIDDVRRFVAKRLLPDDDD